jgi:pectate lyase
VDCAKGSVVDNFTISSPAVAPSASNSVISAVATCTKTALNVSSAISDGGFSYRIIKSFGIPADNNTYPNKSTLRLFENGIEIGPAHARHADISSLGKGRFSHWSATDGSGEALRFSASNNTNPKTNGKGYTYCANTTSDTQAPTVPNGLAATAVSSSQINLSWSAATDNVGVAGYKIFRNGSQVGMSTTATYSNSGLAASTSYTYVVAAYDAAGNSSGSSTTVTTTTSGTTTTTSGATTISGGIVQGFAAAAGVTGGAGGQRIVVTNLNSSGPGSFRQAVEFTTGPRIVTFTPGMTGTINHGTHVYVESDNITIDGAGANITLTGASINPWKSATLKGSSNIIIRNLNFVNTLADKSSIYVVHGANKIWIDHNTFSNNSTGEIGQPIAVWNYPGEDGLTGITISWNRFNMPNKKAVMVGSSEDTVKKNTRVSLHHNWFNGTTARNPRVHGGVLVHMWNNYISNWGEYGVGASALADVLAENNIFENSSDSDAILSAYGGSFASSVNATGNLKIGNLTFQTVGTFPRYKLTYAVTPEVADSALKQRLMQTTGANR